MISRNFANLPIDRIVDFIKNNENGAADRLLLNSIESMSDLWLLANMKESYDKETKSSDCNIDMYDRCGRPR